MALDRDVLPAVSFAQSRIKPSIPIRFTNYAEFERARMGKADIAYFATSNVYKFEEYSRLFAAEGVALRHVGLDIDELQSMDYLSIAEAKSAEAYRLFGIPIVTEVCGIGLDSLNGFPSGLNRKFWEVLGPRVSTITNAIGRGARATVYLSVCDGKRVHHQSVTVAGQIASVPSTAGTFHLDQIFIPKGATVPLSDMKESERDEFSYRSGVVRPAAAMLRSLRILATGPGVT